MTPEVIEAQLGRMVVLKMMPGEVKEHVEAILRRQVPAGVLEAAVTRAIETRSWFPTPAEVLEDCDAVKARVPRPMPERPELREIGKAVIRNPFGGADITVTLTEDPSEHCTDCRDSGWREVPVGTLTVKRNPMTTPGLTRCYCWHTNPVLMAKREAMAQYAAARDQRRS